MSVPELRNTAASRSTSAAGGSSETKAVASRRATVRAVCGWWARYFRYSTVTAWPSCAVLGELKPITVAVPVVCRAGS